MDCDQQTTKSLSHVTSVLLHPLKTQDMSFPTLGTSDECFACFFNLRPTTQILNRLHQHTLTFVWDNI